MQETPAKILLAKTALDGHWRGISVVARALRDAGFEVIMLGMAQPQQIVGDAIDEDVDLIGLNVGGRIEGVERVLDQLQQAEFAVPVFAGGTIAPRNVKRLEARGVEAYPPGSSLEAIADAARRLTAEYRRRKPLYE